MASLVCTLVGFLVSYPGCHLLSVPSATRSLSLLLPTLLDSSSAIRPWASPREHFLAISMLNASLISTGLQRSVSRLEGLLSPP